MIKVSITEVEGRGWSYSVSIGDKFHKIGWGHDYPSAARLAKSGVKSAKKFLETGIEARDFYESK